MHRALALLALPLVCLLVLPGAAPASDETDPSTTENPNRPRREASDQPNSVEEWAKDMGNRASVGLNGLLTAPADPVYFAMEGSEVFSKLPAAKFTGPVVGVFAGVAQMTYRVFTGTFDLAFSWVPYLYMQSPTPRVNVLPWAEHDEA